MSSTLNGWQAVACLLIGAACVFGGVLLGQQGTPLVGLGSSIVGACLGILQPWRSPQMRTRAADRTPTAGQGVPIAPPWETDPNYKTPPPQPQLPPGVTEDRRRRPR